MRLTIEIPKQIYLNAKDDMLCGSEIIVDAIKNGIPQETITEFADRCKECGAKYGRLLQQEPKTGKWIEYPKNSETIVCNQCKGIRRDNRVGFIRYCNRCGAKMEG